MDGEFFASLEELRHRSEKAVEEARHLRAIRAERVARGKARVAPLRCRVCGTTLLSPWRPSLS